MTIPTVSSCVHESCHLTQFFFCLSLKIKFKVILERVVSSPTPRLHTACTFMFENRKKIDNSDNYLSWKELWHLPIKSTTLQMSSLKSTGITANYKTAEHGERGLGPESFSTEKSH